MIFKIELDLAAQKFAPPQIVSPNKLVFEEKKTNIFSSPLRSLDVEKGQRTKETDRKRTERNMKIKIIRQT